MKKQEEGKKPAGGPPKKARLSSESGRPAPARTKPGQTKKGRGPKEAPAEKPGSTEERIKAAALKLFTVKGFAATRTRDIAAEAGINMAMLHYYYRSKEKLFEIVMAESLQQFLLGIKEIISNERTSLEEKIQQLIDNYIDLLSGQPDLPLFIFSEIRTRPEAFVSRMGIREYLQGSSFVKQFTAAMQANKVQAIHPLHFIMNLVSLTVFPFIGRPILEMIGDLEGQAFGELMQERKKLIPLWLKKITAG